ncbi:MAG: SDR family oxidoreductase [Janthinobacterium lividum]
MAGASGVVGRAMLRHFGAVGGWGVTGLSRRLLGVTDSVRVLPLDLQDPAACEAAVAAQLSNTTHLVYCATYEKPNLLAGWLDPDHAAVNEAMLRNMMEPLRRHAKRLEAVLVMQGTKAYGAAAGTFKLPAKEEDPRALAPNFYYGQEDYIREAASADGWRWTALRPQFVCGFALGSPMNGLSGVAAYAAISRELGLPLRFPGGPGRVMEATDSRLLARAAEWALLNPACNGETFNIVNGDVFTWESLWPKVAQHFGMIVAVPTPARLARIMPSHAATWRRLAERDGLRHHDLSELVPNWGMTDYLLGFKTPLEPMLLSGIKARQAGFNDCIDSERMVLEWLDILRAEQIIPALEQTA